MDAGDDAGGSLQRGRQIEAWQDDEEFVSTDAEHRPRMVGGSSAEMVGHEAQYPVSFGMTMLVGDPNQTIDVDEANRCAMADERFL